MKKLINYILPLVLLFFAVSCDKGLEDLNKTRSILHRWIQ